MTKKVLGPKTQLCPMPAVLVGANVYEKPNYLPVAFCGTVNFKPVIIAVGLGKTHHTNKGIRENGTFSINIPSVKMVVSADYCGINSGSKTDKSTIYGTFYGKLNTAPMIKECPLNFECKLLQTIDFPVDEMFIGEVVESYADQKYLTDGVPDAKKVRPILLTMPDNNYWNIGEPLGKAWEIGKKFRK